MLLTCLSVILREGLSFAKGSGLSLTRFGLSLLQQCVPPCLPFLCGSEDQTQILMVVQQGPFQMTYHLSSPPATFNSSEVVEMEPIIYSHTF